MKLSTFKKELEVLENVIFVFENGTVVPEHFHVTEVGMVTKNFIDCGGTVRTEKVVSLQLWEAHDFDHRLKPQKLLSIIALSEKVLGLEDLVIEVEYQASTIGKFGLEFDGKNFVLTTKQTNCLATDKCGIPTEKLNVNLAALTSTPTSCTPGGGCC